MAEPTTTERTDTGSALTGRSTLVNGLVGGAVAIVFAFLPFSPLVGGAVAGYLETEDGSAVRAGVVSGLVALVPFLLIGAFGLAFVLGFAPFSFSLFAVFLFLVVSAYTVGLGALGGVVGAYLETEL